MSSPSSLCSSLDIVAELIRKPTKSVQKDANFSERVRVLMTSLFSCISSHALLYNFSKRKMILFDELVIDDLALEQIWQQADMQLKYFVADSKERLEQHEKSSILSITSFESLLEKTKKGNRNKPACHPSHDANVYSNEEGVMKKKLEALPISKIERSAGTKTLRSPVSGRDTVVEATTNPGLSLFQNAQERIIKQIKLLESEAIAKRNWTHLGESTGLERPKNSIMEMDLEFDQKIQRNPHLSLQASTLLEEIIKDRVLSGSWDDIESCNLLKQSSYIAQSDILQDEKSKSGLGEVYAEEYIKRSQQTVNEIKRKPPVLVSQAQRILESLLVKLDCLTSTWNTQVSEFENFAVSTRDAEEKEISTSPEELYQSKGMSSAKKRTVTTSREGSLIKKQEMQRKNKRKTTEDIILVAGATEQNTRKQEMLHNKKERKDEYENKDRKYRSSDIMRTGYNKSSKIFDFLQERVDQRKNLETVISAPNMIVKL